MKGREGKGVPSADLLVCFPSRAHLKLMPKPICSPARPSDPNNNRLNKSTTTIARARARGGRGRGRGGPGQASPLLWAKSKSMGSEISEPTSPKVTCAGQIKVRHKSGSCRSWQSVMEEIERIHTTRHHHNQQNQQQRKKKPNWVESLGFKKDIMHFLTCLRTIRLDFRCFGSFHESDITSDDDEEEEEEDRYRGNNNNHGEVVVGGGGDDQDAETSRTVFSKWFMVLQEDQKISNNGFCKELDKKDRGKQSSDFEGDGSIAVVPPPPNALLLMRCRSAPAKTWLEEKNKQKEKEEEDEDENGGGRDEKEEKKGRSLRCLMEEEKRKSKAESLVVMRYETDLYTNISSDIAKETWIVGGMRDALSKSRSWKR